LVYSSGSPETRHPENMTQSPDATLRPHISDLPLMLTRLGGAAHATSLHKLGISPKMLVRAHQAGGIERIRRGWYGVPEHASDRVRAIRVGGRLDCVSLLRTHSVWLMPDTRLHVGVTVPRRQLRSPLARNVSLDDWAGEPYVVAHWRAHLNNPAEPVNLIDDAAASVALCLPRDHAIVAFDSLLNRKALSHERLRAALAGLPDSHEWMMELVDAGCGSGLETLIRLMLRGHRVVVRSQVHVPGIGWVDLLVGDRLVIEADSRAHHDDPKSYERDRARDLALTGLGYLVVRITYKRVMYDMPAVEQALMTIIRRQEHRWQTLHRTAGVARRLE
jgi:very-short-patch-repair endonuclease